MLAIAGVLRLVPLSGLELLLLVALQPESPGGAMRQGVQHRGRGDPGCEIKESVARGLIVPFLRGRPSGIGGAHHDWVNEGRKEKGVADVRADCETREGDTVNCTGILSLRGKGDGKRKGIGGAWLLRSTHSWRAR